MAERTWKHKAFPWDEIMQQLVRDMYEITCISDIADVDIRTFHAEGVGGLRPCDFWRNKVENEDLLEEIMGDFYDLIGARPVNGKPTNG